MRPLAAAAEGTVQSLPDLEAWAMFAKVAEFGSFRRAAADLGLSKATVSKTIARLERRMRATLLHRTTRQLSLTESGRLSLARARRILIDGAAIEADILEEAEVPRGLVRMACVTSFGVEALTRVLPEFFAAYPEVMVDLRLSEEPLDIVAAGVDLAIRIGTGEDSSLRSSRLFSFRQLVVAAPALIERLGEPACPDDLARFPAVTSTNGPRDEDWALIGPDGEVAMTRMAGRYRVNHATAVVQAVVAGAGLALIPEFFLWRELRDGRLCQLLPDWTPPLSPVHVLTPPSRVRPARVRVLMAFLRDHFAGQPWAQGIEA